MSKVAVEIDNLSKLYRLGEISTGSLAHDVNRWWHRLCGNEDPYRRVGETNDRTVTGTSEYVWALRHIGLTVQQGEVVGIIGRNGAGKSTLLKILSRVTAPTEGTIRVRGRIASLLEVGTGFNPELTGLENIYLNGAILGMRRQEIKRKLDEIVDFSGCERYIETPVKRYSSGMYVRLAFAVAAYLEPEILIVDEVLAVGDGDFQKKCLGKLKSMHGQGRTVIVVSHQMSMITGLCDRGIVIKNGIVDFDGTASDAVLHYQPSEGQAKQAMFDASLLGKRIGDERAQLHRAWTENEAGEIQRTFDLGSPVIVKMEYSITQEENRVRFPNFHLFDERGEYVLVTPANGTVLQENSTSTGRFVAQCTLPPHLLNTGTYYIGVCVTAMDPGVVVSFFERDALSIQITEDLEVTLDTFRNGYGGLMPGVIRPNLDWQISKRDELVPITARAF